MEVNRVGTKITIDLNKEEDARGLYAVLTQSQVSPEVYANGDWLYKWFFNAVQKLALNYPHESSIQSQSMETMSALQKAAMENKKPRKR